MNWFLRKSIVFILYEFTHSQKIGDCAFDYLKKEEKIKLNKKLRPHLKATILLFWNFHEVLRYCQSISVQLVAVPLLRLWAAFVGLPVNMSTNRMSRIQFHLQFLHTNRYIFGQIHKPHRIHKRLISFYYPILSLNAPTMSTTPNA